MTKKSKRPLPTKQRLRELLDYNPATGVLTWKAATHPNKRFRVGKRAGSRNKSTGYIEIQIDGHGRKYLAHRVVFCMMTGRWPTELVDHKNRKPSDLRWKNLREATHAQNMCNAISRNPLGKGVRKAGSGYRFQATIRIKGEKVYLGTYRTAKLAAAAYADAARRHHGEFART